MNLPIAQPDAGKVAGEGRSTERRRRRIDGAVYADVVLLVDFLVVTVAALGSAAFYLGYVRLAPFDLQLYGAMGIIGATVLTTILRRDGLYEPGALVRHGASRAVFMRWTFVVFALIAFAYALKATDVFSRGCLAIWYVTSAAVLALSRTTAAAFLRAKAQRGDALFAPRVAIIGAGASIDTLAELIGDGEHPGVVVGVFAMDLGGGASPYNFDLSGGVEALERLARAGEVDDIVIVEPGDHPQALDALVGRLSILPVTISICPHDYWLRHTGGELARIGRAPVMRLYRRPLEGWGSFVKFAEDKILGALFLLAASPIMLLVAAAIVIEGKGPILFSQRRHGFNHAVFCIYKFRTMTVADDGPTIVQAQRNDPRVTKVGKFLRRYSLDELPQLFNVLKGDMSLVGPRPHALAHNDYYAQTIENYAGRHKMKPGITGWAQVNGLRGETSETEHMAERVRYDLDYVDNWSLWFDLRILSRTARAVVFPKNAH